jgi:predicted negative regulator of RcsB-dependent stress response
MENGNGNKGNWWKSNIMNFIWIIVVGIITWGMWTTRRSDALTLTAESNVRRIVVLEKTVSEIIKDQPIRDYLLGAMAKEHGIRVPTYFGERP